MTAKFLMIDDGSAALIVQATLLQSTSFSAGIQLAKIITRGSSTFSLVTDYSVIKSGAGIYILHPSTSRNFMVIDFTATDPFSGSEEVAITIFQRLLRFAVRRWTGRRPSHADRHIQNSTKFAVFPFGIGTQSKYRISVETSPDPKRVEKRFPGHHLLVYQDGYDSGTGPDFSPDLHIYRQAFQGLRDARAASSQAQSKASTPHSPEGLRVCPLSKRDADPVSEHIGFEKWMSLLTEAQREFVIRLPKSAERVQGPAGTGKTLSLVLKCINALLKSKEAASDFHAAFFAHSEATKATIEAVFYANCPDLEEFLVARTAQRQTLVITTLQAWCAARLGQATVSASQFLDQDALAAKEYRRLIIEDCVKDAKSRDFATHKPFLSEQFANFVETEETEVVADLLQHEIAVMIKGRAGENLDVYQSLPFVKYGLPCEIAADRAFVFVIFDRYVRTLAETGEFDTDDVVLTALSSLENPIWRRKRGNEGYDAVFVDETHLFNLNELSVFHHLTRGPDQTAIVFSADRSQAPGIED